MKSPMSRSLRITAAISLALLALVSALAHELDDKLTEQVAHVSALAKVVPADTLKDGDRVQTFLGHLADTRIGSSGYRYLFASDRTLIVHPDRSRILKKDVPPGTNPMFDRAVAGFQGSGVTVNSRGLKVLASFKRLESAPWILAANFPCEEAYASIFRTGQHLALGIAAVMIGTGLVLFFIFRHMKVEVGRRADAEDYANQLIEAAADGVIGVTSEGRIRFVNKAALKLLGYQSARPLLGGDLHALVHHSHPDGSSYQPGDCPVRACAARGESQRVEDEACWRADGSALPVNYHCARCCARGLSTACW